MAVSHSNDHLLAYLDILQPDSAVSGGWAWLQAGFGVGAVDSVYASSKATYVEEGDVTGIYQGAYFSSLPTGDSNGFIISDTGLTGHSGRTEYYAYEYNEVTSTMYPLKQGWFPHTYALYAQATVEAAMGTAGTCPTMTAALFGTYGSLTSWDAGSYLQLNKAGVAGQWRDSAFPSNEMNTPSTGNPYSITYGSGTGDSVFKVS